ncbi:MAG: NAD(P)H-dependent oxidoreductase [Oscillospiraceae bacterium]|nr:NAD(P)H-dependent oxidoreductase [Oscillospiraceae bacterium]
MKKIFAAIISLAVAVSLTACSSSSEQDQASAVSTTTANSSTENNAPTSEEKPEVSDGSNTESSANDSTSGSNILVAYFSRVGNTVWEDDVDAVTSASLNVVNGEYEGNAQILAQMAQEVTGGDLFLIQTENAYPSDYRKTTDVAADEQHDNARPALSSHVENMEQYDTIVLIYPNWWGTLPQALFTFLEEYDFSGKTILPLCTHGGSRMGSSERDIASLCPDANLLEGLAVSGSSAASAQSDIEKWITDSGII